MLHLTSALERPRLCWQLADVLVLTVKLPSPGAGSLPHCRGTESRAHMVRSADVVDVCVLPTCPESLVAFLPHGRWKIACYTQL